MLRETDGILYVFAKHLPSHQGDGRKQHQQDHVLDGREAAFRRPTPDRRQMPARGGTD
jgi:hypothetical protein